MPLPPSRPPYYCGDDVPYIRQILHQMMLSYVHDWLLFHYDHGALCSRFRYDLEYWQQPYRYGDGDGYHMWKLSFVERFRHLLSSHR